jgi:hypothetical protein
MVGTVSTRRDDKNRLAFEPVICEAAQIVLDSLWKDSVRPAILKFFSQKDAYRAARRAGTDALARVAAVDPLMDTVYENIA